MKTRPNRHHDAAQSRAALEALFSNSGSVSATPSSPSTLEGDVLIAKKAADANAVSSRIDLLRRKREAIEAIQEAAVSAGLSLDELREAANETGKRH